MIRQEKNRLVRRFDKEYLEIEPWGDGFRVRATERDAFTGEELSALLPKADGGQKSSGERNCGNVPTRRGTSAEASSLAENYGITVTENGAEIVNGKTVCRIDECGEITFLNRKGDILLKEYNRTRNMYHTEGHFQSALEICARTFEPFEASDNYKLTVRFEACDDEMIFGMGQYQQPFLNLKGCTLELAQRNSQASVPFMISNKGYGFLWNNPAIGQVTFARNVTEWTAGSTKQMDYFIVAGDTPAEIEESYAKVTGTVPMMPEYGMGFWQCKLRYQTQDEILKIAREYHRRNIPVDVIVVDYFHWPHEGDWDFDRDYWPDPAEMVRELKSYGMNLMVSIWPTVDEESVSYGEMTELGYLVRSEYGKRIGQLGNACIIDVTNPGTRKYVWNIIKKNYYDLGIRIFWLDEAEPELTGYEYSHYRYHIGADRMVGNLFPREYARMAFEGMRENGQENPVNLLRCAWAGSQRYGALVWSGDIDSSFTSLRNQLRAGLNMGIAGIPWWTTDIGGFHGGRIDDPKFRECFTRWFEFGTFCPVMRLHGCREPFSAPLGTTGGGKQCSGADNEIWTYGDEIYEICKNHIELREKLRPYIRSLMREAHEKGTPIIRPLFYEFPEDKKAWETDDEFMFGPDILVAPVLYEDIRERKVYLPEGNWKSLFEGTVVEGGREITAAAPIEWIPAFSRA